MARDIVQVGDDILRQEAEFVDADDIRSKKIAQVIKDMKTTLQATPDGVAIAAPQIGESYRIFVVSGKVYDQYEKEQRRKDGEEEDSISVSNPDRTFINPEIIKASKDRYYLDEGCLSVKNYFGSAPRHAKVTVRAQDENGVEFVEGRSGLLAQIFQHEIDHLNGILFIDTAKDVEYREPEQDTTN